MATKSKSNRYSGIDSTPWKVRYSDGTEMADRYTGFKEADNAAQQANNTDGPYAQAVRA